MKEEYKNDIKIHLGFEAEYYPLYQATYRAVRRLNAKYNYDIPLKVGGFAMSGCMGRWNIWHQFLKLMAADEVKLKETYNDQNHKRSASHSGMRIL